MGPWHVTICPRRQWRVGIYERAREHGGELSSGDLRVGSKGTIGESRDSPCACQPLDLDTGGMPADVGEGDYVAPLCFERELQRFVWWRGGLVTRVGVDRSIIQHATTQRLHIRAASSAQQQKRGNREADRKAD